MEELFAKFANVFHHQSFVLYGRFLAGLLKMYSLYVNYKSNLITKMASRKILWHLQERWLWGKGYMARMRNKESSVQQLVHSVIES